VAINQIMTKNIYPWAILLAGSLFGCKSKPQLPVEPSNICTSQDNSCLYLQDRAGYVTAWIPESNTTKWVSDLSLGGYPKTIQADQNRILSIFSQGYDLRSASDGRHLAQGPLTLSHDNQPLWAKNQLFYLSSTHDLVSVNLESGEFTWMLPGPVGVGGFWASWDTSVFFIPGTGHYVMQLDLETGKLEDSLPLTAPKNLPAVRLLSDLCIVSGNQAAAFVERELIVFEFSPLKVKWHTTLSETPNACILRGEAEILVSLPQSDGLASYDLLSGQQGPVITGAASSASSGLLVDEGWIWVRRTKSVIGFPPLASLEVQTKELPSPALFGQFRVGNQIGVVLSDGTWIAWDQP
jgi:hypothetical protein